ncbi:polymorphic toxin type 44 domain-containing protein [Aneurinibacillus thermoaerophilus]|uniref:polymorphic toxin type 44 domain-containing protein n=1 Tax=Aneurinibacillus thermoaerophilus TaxID=143495 RepID=UPI002E2333C0|nr:polymorphic toxin type 44 domain-containing protein [Aneurinibacillus thermoaerophilus]
MASEEAPNSVLQKTDVQVLASYPNITSSFSKTLKNNAAYIAYYAMWDKDQGTYPAGTGLEFASKVKSGGEWDYKRTLGPSTKYEYNGYAMRGEDLGNVHYGFVGRAAGFAPTILRSAAGAYQIYSGTSMPNWWSSYFDDPIDQQYINFGINMWDNGTLPKTLSAMHTESMTPSIEDAQLFNLLTDSEKKEIEEKAKKNSAKIKKELKEQEQKQQQENK